MEIRTKANALYRDGAKLSQPLSSSIVEDEEVVVEDNSTKEKTIMVAEKIARDYVKEIVRSRKLKSEKVLLRVYFLCDGVKVFGI